METPIGMLTITVDGEELVEVRFGSVSAPPPVAGRRPALYGEVIRQLSEYFAGTRRTFDLPLAFRGTEFQKAVWSELTRVPYGVTMSYGELAARIGRPDAVRAVGAANGANPIPIIVPCHRIIGANGSLTGYGGGLDRKRWLLDLERRGRKLF